MTALESERRQNEDDNKKRFFENARFSSDIKHRIIITAELQ